MFHMPYFSRNTHFCIFHVLYFSRNTHFASKQHAPRAIFLEKYAILHFPCAVILEKNAFLHGQIDSGSNLVQKKKILIRVLCRTSEFHSKFFSERCVSSRGAALKKKLTFPSVPHRKLQKAAFLEKNAFYMESEQF